MGPLNLFLFILFTRLLYSFWWYGPVLHFVRFTALYSIILYYTAPNIMLVLESQVVHSWEYTCANGKHIGPKNQTVR